MRRLVVLSFMLFLTGVMPAPAQHKVPTNMVLEMATAAARRDGYSPSGSRTYINELAYPDGREPLDGYSVMGLYENGRRVKVYAERETTGDIVELKTCTLYRYPEMLAHKKPFLGLREVTLNGPLPPQPDVAPDQVAAELGCARLRVVPMAGTDAELASSAASALSKFDSLSAPVPGSFVPTSTMIRLGKVIARDEGYDVRSVGLDEWSGRNGPEPADGYNGIVLIFAAHPLAWIMIRSSTGDIIDRESCRLYRYPDLRDFRREQMRLTHSRPISARQIADEVGCSHMAVETRKHVPVELKADSIP